MGPFLSVDQILRFLPFLEALNALRHDVHGEYVGTVENWKPLTPPKSCLESVALSVWDEVDAILDRRHLDYALERLEGFKERRVELSLILSAESYLKEQQREFDEASRLSKEFEKLGIPKVYHRDSYKELA